MDRYGQELQRLLEKGDLRTLPDVRHEGKWIVGGGRRMLNLSSNDYLGLAADKELRREFMETLDEEDFLFSSSSSRLLTGNFDICTRLEDKLAGLFRAESALVFSSGYHMNAGILPAISDSHTLILADKLVHASLIDGIRLSPAHAIRYRHQDYGQLESLVDKYRKEYERIVIVTESVFSMDGDVTDLRRLVSIKRLSPQQILLYVDEAHAIGVRGRNGLGIAEEQGCVPEVDFLCGTFGKAMASVGAYVVCRRELRDYLVNKMRTLIFTTALPPVNLAWTCFLLERLPQWKGLRMHLDDMAARLRNCLGGGEGCVSGSHIIPLIEGESGKAVLRAEELRRKGFYVLPVRPPTVPEGTSRLRFSLRADIADEELDALITCLK